jgi:DNA-binding MarR family transcriptional regulator
MNERVPSADASPDPAAIRLAVAIKRLRAKLREAGDPDSIALPISQVAILQYLRRKGPATAADLAVAEHVSQQAIAQNLAALKRAGLVEARPDPNDGRKSLIHVTAAGNQLFEAIISSRNAWLAQAIQATIAPAERPALDKAIELLERLADADPSSRPRGEAIVETMK